MALAKTHAVIRAWRLLRIVCHLLWGVFLAAVLFPLVNTERRQQVIMTWSAGVMRLLHVKLKISGQVPGKDVTSVMFVANHISWLDIWAINSIQPVRFVAKSDVRNWPVIGWLSRKTGVIFIQRERRRDTARVSSLGAQVLLAGECLCVFPEGTTTEGGYMLPFRSSLLQAAIDAEATIWPVALRYPMEDGSANTAVAYAGETTLWESICAIVAQPSIPAELIFLPPISARQDRRAIAQAAENAVRTTLNLPLREEPETLADLPLAML